MIYSFNKFNALSVVSYGTHATQHYSAQYASSNISFFYSMWAEMIEMG